MRSFRRLAFESLERRDLLAVMRLVTFNTLNGPDNLPTIPPTMPNDGNYFKTILEAIGNETVQGNTKPIDILAVQEIDQSGNQSLTKLESILDSLYPSTNYASIMSSEVAGDATGFIYDTSTVSLEGMVEITAGLTHPVLRAHFRPADTFGESDFYVYSIHLKAGTSGSDATMRGNEAAVLRANADALGSGANVIFVGDFNLQNGSETAYTTFVSAGAGQLQDLGNSAGNWHGNSAFKSLHTQDPRFTGSGMDDRFDIQFVSTEFFDDVGIDYIEGSYRVFGNNGSHTMGDDIASGGANGASAAVLTALANASDHLPVVADYEVIVSTPRVRLIQTSGGTKVAEGGFYDTYGVVLDTVPAANVTVEITPGADLNLGAGAGNPVSLLFTPANALTPQFIVVTAHDDALSEGNETATITHTSTSSDAAYNGLSIPNLNVTVLDNESPALFINEIDSDQVGSDTLEFIEIYDGGVGNVSLSGKTLVFFNGATDTAYLTIPLTGFTDANGFYVVGNSAVPGVGQTFGNGLLQNGVDAVALYNGAFSNGGAVTTANLIDAVVYNTGTGTDEGLAVLLLPGQPVANESAGSSPTTHSVSRVPDGGDARKTETFVAQTPTPGARNQPATPGVFLFHSGTRIDVTEGGVADSYQIALKSIPTSDVLITVDPDTQTDLGLGAGVPIVLTFTPANALIPQTVTVTAVDDIFLESSTHTTVITHSVSSSDSAYNAFPIGNVVGIVADNEVFDPSQIVISEIMYNPFGDETAPGLAEWVEIVNTSAAAVDLAGWFLRDNDTPDWGTVPAGTYLYPNQVAVYFDAAFATKAEFKAQWSVPDTALLLPVSWQGLVNSGLEDLTLRYGAGLIADAVNYEVSSPWPASTNGRSIYLKGLLLDNSQGANWAQSLFGVNGAIRGNGAKYVFDDHGSPGRVYIPGDYDMSGGSDAADYVVWRHFLGSTTVRPPDGSGPTTGLPNGTVDEFDYSFWSQNFGRQPAPVVDEGGGGSSDAGSELALVEPTNVTSQSASNAFVVSIDVLQSSPSTIAPKALTTPSTSLQRTSADNDLLLLLDGANSLEISDEDVTEVPHEDADVDSATFDEVFDQLAEDADLVLFN